MRELVTLADVFCSRGSCDCAQDDSPRLVSAQEGHPRPVSAQDDSPRVVILREVAGSTRAEDRPRQHHSRFIWQDVGVLAT